MKISHSSGKAIFYNKVCVVISSICTIAEIMMLYMMSSRDHFLTGHIQKEFFDFAMKFETVPSAIFIVLSIVFLLLAFGSYRVGSEYYKINICLKNRKELMSLCNGSRLCLGAFIVSGVCFFIVFVMFIK